MNLYRIDYYYLAQGMPHADEYFYGAYTADTAQEAIEEAIKGKSHKEFLKSCLTATRIEDS